ncbi:MAG: trypsin-like peptidase domain-containing protein [Bacteroidota bacterium]|nr:trypsin-like peptidase domain-containing protein [Bacteroidota bacterium]
MKNKLLIIFLFCFSFKSYGQKPGVKKDFQQALFNAIEKAYPASVRMWGFDTVSKQQMSGQFSGVVVTADGYILTAAHVTVPGKTYKVMFPDGRETIAVALGKIELAADKTIPDVAMMKIVAAGPWPLAPIGNSLTLKKSDPCISIAYPESLGRNKPSVRYGQISNVKNERGFIQSSCIMEPGDSGGPLFDLNGNVIGIHSAIEVPEVSNYEIPVELYQKYWAALKSPAVYTSLPDSSQAISFVPERAIEPHLPGSNTIEAKLKNYCLSIESRGDGKLLQAVGTLFSSGGLQVKLINHNVFVMSKSSLIGTDSIFAITKKGKISLKVASRDIHNDLVLLIPAGEISGGVPLRALNIVAETRIVPGRLLISPVPDSANVFSIVSTEVFNSPKIMSAGFLGAAIAYNTSPMVITVIQPNSPASGQDLKVGDRILSINGVPMNRPENYAEQLQKYWPGDTIAVAIERTSRLSVKKIVLSSRSEQKVNHPAAFFKGGKSGRMDGFEQVFSHDAVLTPQQIGGPVFNIDGNFCGINIARYSRAVSLVLPAETIYSFFKREVLE